MKMDDDIVQGRPNLDGPAAAVIRRPQALSGFIGRKESVGGLKSFSSNPDAQHRDCEKNFQARGWER